MTVSNSDRLNRELVTKIAKKHLTSQEMPEFTNLEEPSPLTRILGYSETGGAHADESLRFLKGNGICNFIARRFLHQVASKKRENDLSHMYVFPTGAKDQKKPEKVFSEGKEFVVNNSETCCEHLIEFMGRRSEEFRTRRERSQQPLIDKYVLKGPRGCGKTFLLNYLLIVKRELWRGNKICYVRVSLMRSYRGWDLANRLYLQTAIIVTKHYIGNDKSSEQYRNFEEFVQTHENLGMTASEVFQAIEFLPELPPERYVSDPTEENDQQLDEPNSSLPKLFSVLQRYIETELGESFLFIIDGLDAALPTTECQKWLREWLYQLPELLNNKNRFSPANWMVCLRDETFQEYELLQDNITRPLLGAYVLTLNYPSVAKVIRNRFEWASILDQERDSEPVLTEPEWYNIAIYFEYFVTLGVCNIRGQYEPSPQMALDVLDSQLRDAFEGNYRKLMTVFTHCMARFFYTVAKTKGMVVDDLLERGMNESFKKLLGEIRFEGDWHAESVGGPLLNSQSSTKTDFSRIVSSRAHEVLGAFMHGDKIVHKIPFKYDRNEHDALIVKKVPAFNFASSFFPNIFSVSPILTGKIWNATNPEHTDILNFQVFTQLYLLYVLEQNKKLSETSVEARFKDVSSPHMTESILTDMKFYGLVVKSAGTDDQIFYELGQSAHYLNKYLLTSSAYWVSSFDTTPVYRELVGKIDSLYKVALDTDKPRGQRFIVRIRIAYCYMRYLQALWHDQISDEFKAKLNRGFDERVAKTLEKMERSLDRLLHSMASAFDTKINTSIAESYARYLIGVESLEDARVQIEKRLQSH